MLREKNVADSTWVSITADNGPEVSPQGGQGTNGLYANPGRTNGLRGEWLLHAWTDRESRAIVQVSAGEQDVSSEHNTYECCWAANANPDM